MLYTQTHSYMQIIT